jgi:4-carboxymuconolactone decarboxylase
MASLLILRRPCHRCRLGDHRRPGYAGDPANAGAFDGGEERSMPDSKRRERGLAKMQEVYAGDVAVPPAGASDFADLMLENLFGEVWTREELGLRDRRLITMGVIAALGERDTYAIQVRAALKNGELSAGQLREVLIHLAQYAGYPRTAGLIGPTEKAIAEHHEAQEDRD